MTAWMHAPAWLLKLNELLRKLGLPVHELVVAQRTLTVRLGPGAGTDLIVRIRAKAPDACGFAQTERLQLSYDGQRELSGQQRAWLETVTHVVAKLEQRLVAELDVEAGMFADELPAEVRLERLFPFCAVERSTAAGRTIVEVLVRTTSVCNQRCPFCSARKGPEVSTSSVRAALQAAAQWLPHATLTLTGGEPALRPTFLDEVHWAVAQATAGGVQVQTNAVCFAHDCSPALLPASPRLTFFVSLHALDPGLYDACTGTTGQLNRALQGLQNILDAGHRVIVNCVVCELNAGHLDTYVRELSHQLQLRPDTELHFSSLICAESSPSASRYLVAYPTLVPALVRAVKTAQARGLVVQSLRSSTHAALPACVLPEHERDRNPHRTLRRPGEPARGFAKGPQCHSCLEAPWCPGVPDAYAERFGLAQLTPIEAL